MQEVIQLPKLLQKIKALREDRLRAEHVAFSFMKRWVQPLMAHDTLGYQYTGDEDTSRMLGNEVDDEDIVERLCVESTELVDIPRVADVFAFKCLETI
jgi:hypothetical protein